MPVDVQFATALTVPAPERIVEWAEAALACAEPERLPESGARGPDRQPVEVCIRVVDAEESAALNERYRNRPGATNVLSFAADWPPAGAGFAGLDTAASPGGGPDGAGLQDDAADGAGADDAGAERAGPDAAAGWPPLRVLGDLVICAPVVATEAASQGKAPDAHFAHMVVHGILHLLGYDHESAAEAERMEQRERAVLARFEIGDPYREG